MRLRNQINRRYSGTNKKGRTRKTTPSTTSVDEPLREPVGNQQSLTVMRHGVGKRGHNRKPKEPARLEFSGAVFFPVEEPPYAGIDQCCHIYESRRECRRLLHRNQMAELDQGRRQVDGIDAIRNRSLIGREFCRFLPCPLQTSHPWKWRAMQNKLFQIVTGTRVPHLMLHRDPQL